MPWDLVIDGLFGTGLRRPLSGQLREIVMLVNALTCPVLALDVPSGLDADIFHQRFGVFFQIAFGAHNLLHPPLAANPGNSFYLFPLIPP